jgi:NADH-quinone oxidoreductase subunit C
VSEPPGADGPGEAGVPGAPSELSTSGTPAESLLPGVPVEPVPSKPDAAAPPSAGADPLAVELRQELGEAIVEVGTGQDADLTILVRRDDVATVGAALRSRFRYTLLVDLCAVDYPQRPLRFEIVYHLYSFRENRRLRVKVRAGERSPVPSVAGIWRGAAWAEREAHDLFGVEFSGHPRLSPILLWEGFEGHPLRKDFPLAGIDTGGPAAPAATPRASTVD